MKKEYIVLGIVGLVGIYFLIKKKHIIVDNRTDILGGSVNIDDKSFDCNKAKAEYPKLYNDSVSEYNEMMSKIHAFSAVSPEQREKAICAKLKSKISK
jgi:phosphatidylserine/phosphatidylglycerophosphate/cardiolipin synthase-like enzyme